MVAERFNLDPYSIPRLWTERQFWLAVAWCHGPSLETPQRADWYALHATGVAEPPKFAAKDEKPSIDPGLYLDWCTR